MPLDDNFWRNMKPGFQREWMNNFTSIIGGVMPKQDLVGDGWTTLFREVIENMAKGAEGADVAALMEEADDVRMQEIRNRVDAIVTKDKETREGLKAHYSRW